MFKNVLVWNFETFTGDIRKELNIYLDHDTPLDAIEQVAVKMIAHCAKVKEASAQAAQVPPITQDAIDPPQERLDEV